MVRYPFPKSDSRMINDPMVVSKVRVITQRMSIKFSCVEEVSRDKLKRVNIFKWQKMHKLALYVNSVHREATSSEKEVEATSSDEDAWPAGVKPSSLSCTR